MIPILHVHRGLPGAGKTAAALQHGCLVLNPNDDFSIRQGRYFYDADADTAALWSAAECAGLYLRQGRDVAVAEVFATIDEVHAFESMLLSHRPADAEGRWYELRVYDHVITHAQALQRNTHAVKPEDLLLMARAWEPWPAHGSAITTAPAPAAANAEE